MRASRRTRRTSFRSKSRSRTKSQRSTRKVRARASSCDDLLTRKRSAGEQMNQKLNELDQELILAEKRCKAAKESDEIAVPKIKSVFDSARRFAFDNLFVDTPSSTDMH